MDDEFVKLIRRMNPPRHFFLIISSVGLTENDDGSLPSLRGSIGSVPSEESTSIELNRNRPSLLSEVCVVLTDLYCNVVNAELWTRNARVVSVVHVTNDTPEDRNRLAIIKEMLCNVLKGNNDLKTAKLTLSSL
ncbi:ACT domain-containing protein ACR6 [Forsythia ovata]|uniref:ACT domain-containing protein ACR n=1 Tax=Forsythia ovata TaxID=205694 RepID=A0ABD1T337_9LAMI